MYTYETHKITEHITQIIDPSEVACFLVEGLEKAILIDTGIGIRGLKEEVEMLTDKPYEVVLTHGHGDHAGGCSAFDTVYVFPQDLELLYAHGLNMRIGYTQGQFEVAKKLFGIEPRTAFDIEKEMLPEPAADKKFEELKDGMTFDLGGVTIEIILAAGHTRGCCAILIPEDRTILFGDACNCNTLVGGSESAAISEYKESLLHLQTFKSRFDTVLYSHGPAIGPERSLEDNIELCDRILAGTDDKIPTIGFAGPGYLAAERLPNSIDRADGKYGNIFYSERTKR